MEERRKIARDLHDSVTQVLFSLNLLAQTLEPGVAPADEIIGKINQLSRRGLQDMRSLLEELRPVSTESRALTLGQKIASYAGSLVGLPEYVIEDGGFDGAPEGVEAQLLGIASEALNNVAKHSGANQVKIVLQSFESGVKLMVEDDGMGMRRESRPKQRGGLGLSTMKERAAEIGANLEIDSRPGKGTSVRVVWEAS
jgi:NarL family two-component system sensor histidine kinase LiaS